MSHWMKHKTKPKISFLFRLQIAILHFNENSDREQATDDSERFNIAFPKYKKGEHTVKKILVKCMVS